MEAKAGFFIGQGVGRKLGESACNIREVKVLPATRPDGTRRLRPKFAEKQPLPIDFSALPEERMLHNVAICSPGNAFLTSGSKTRSTPYKVCVTSLRKLRMVDPLSLTKLPARQFP